MYLRSTLRVRELELRAVVRPLVIFGRFQLRGKIGHGHRLNRCKLSVESVEWTVRWTSLHQRPRPLSDTGANRSHIRTYSLESSYRNAIADENVHGGVTPFCTTQLTHGEKVESEEWVREVEVLRRVAED